jgi:hypothetical protein
VAAVVAELGLRLGALPYGRGSADFQAVGDPRGLAIVVGAGRGWFPTGRPAGLHRTGVDAARRRGGDVPAARHLGHRHGPARLRRATERAAGREALDRLDPDRLSRGAHRFHGRRRRRSRRRPGGYPAAIRAAQLGLSVAVIEQGPLGGTCLNVGCIPTKAWVQSSHALKDAHEAFAQLGVNVGEVSVDFAQMQRNKDAIVKKMVQGVGGLLKAAGAQVVQGRGTFTGPNTISVEGGEDVTFRHAVIATGSAPLRPPIDGIDAARCVDSTGLLAVEEIPRRLIVLGAA